MEELGIDFEMANISIIIDPLKYKNEVIKYIKKANCGVHFTDKSLKCAEAIDAIEKGTPEGIAICERVIADALHAFNNLR